VKGKALKYILLQISIFANLIALTSINGCAYRFTNKALRSPQGIRNIAIEAVYDTSQKVIPHQIFWHQVQQAFARNSQLTIVPASEADALIRLHIKSATITPTGEAKTQGPNFDPEVETSDQYFIPSQFRNITRAGRWRTTEAIGFTVDMEVRNLHTNEVIHKANYSTGGTFRSYRVKENSATKTHFLLYEEALYTKFKSLSQEVAYKMVSDLLL
tara:strand:+ start:46 stop:690 length:645 start_codon:yes stop_codon:yes gene_type:complete